MAVRYFKLTRRAWCQLRTGRTAPIPPALYFDYMLGAVRSAIAMLQSLWPLPQLPQQSGPVVILGFWRSGTTLLHELLSVDDRLCYPSTYACLNPHHFVLTNWWAGRRPNDVARRPQDGMAMGWLSPQEDEFALISLGARSPYEGLLVPQAYGQAFSLADPADLAPAEERRWKRIFLRFLRGVSHTNGGKIIVIKSPAHSYRVKTIRALLPNARFVLIVRNPYEALESMVKTYRAFAKRYGLGPTLADDEVRDILIQERNRFEKKMRAGLEGLAADQLITIRYEEMAHDTATTLQAIYNQLGLPDFEYVRPRLAGEMAKRSQFVKNSALPDAHWTGLLNREWREIFQRYGYRQTDGTTTVAPSQPSLLAAEVCDADAA